MQEVRLAVRYRRGGVSAKTFTVELERVQKKATMFRVPFDLAEAFGRARPPVKVTIRDHTWRTTPGVYDGVGYIVVNRAVKAATGVDAGDRVRVRMELDTGPRKVEVPEDLRAALGQAPDRDSRFRGAGVHAPARVRGVGGGSQASGDAGAPDRIDGRPRRVGRAEAMSPEIAERTTVGPVHLTVADLARSLDYYGGAIGLDVRERSNSHAELGTSERELLVLVEHRGARPAYGHTGLYHFALLLPERAELARWLAHAGSDSVPLVGLSDHFVSEAIYLSDPDGHGIEIYWDRPREIWDGQVFERLTTLPLDVGNLLAELPEPEPEPFERLPDGTVMGHVHLKVAAIPTRSRSIAMYSASSSWRSWASRQRSFPPAATTITSVRTRGKVPARRQRRRGWPLCGTRRSSCPTRRSATA